MQLAHTHRHCDTLRAIQIDDAQTQANWQNESWTLKLEFLFGAAAQVGQSTSPYTVVASSTDCGEGHAPTHPTDTGKKTTPQHLASYLHHSKRSNAHLVLVANDERRGVLRNWLRCAIHTGSVDELGNTMLALLSKYGDECVRSERTRCLCVLEVDVTHRTSAAAARCPVRMGTRRGVEDPVATR